MSDVLGGKLTFCTNCGKEIATGCRFCTNCGTPVNTNPDNNPVIVNQAPLQSETTVTSQSETPIEPPVTHQNDSTFNNGQFTQTTTPQNTNAFDNGQFTQQPAAPQNTNAFDNEQFTQTPDSNNELPKQASSKKKILLISLIVLLVAAAAVGTAVLLKSNHIFDKS